MTITDLPDGLDLAATLAQLAEQVSAAQAKQAQPPAGASGHADPIDDLVEAGTIVGLDAVNNAIGVALAVPHHDAVWIAPAGHVLSTGSVGSTQLPLRMLVQHPQDGSSAVGLAVRVAPLIPREEVLIIDASTMLMPTRDATGVPRLVVVRQRLTAMVVSAVFESLWAGAVPAHRVGAVHGALENAQRRDVVRLLAAGATDDTIARRLGISKRTCARHVAHILACSGASSRFQAGVMLARSGVGIPA